MPRSRTPSKRSSKKKASAGPVDLNDPIMNCAVTTGALIAFGCLGHLSGGDALKLDHLGGFAEPGYAGAVFNIFGSDHNLHARWAATLFTTLSPSTTTRIITGWSVASVNLGGRGIAMLI